MLTPDEVSACRSHGVPLGYDCAQCGWVPLCVGNEEGAERVFDGTARGGPSGDASPVATGEVASAARDPRPEEPSGAWWAGFEAALEALLRDFRARTFGVPVARERVRRAVHDTVTEIYRTGGLRDAERAHWALRVLAANRCPMLRAPTPKVAPDVEIRFRRWTAGDAPTFRALLGNPRVWEFLPEPFPEPFDETTARTLIELGSLDFHHRALAVEWKGETVGQCLVRFDAPEDSRTAEVAYWLGEDHWGQGLMSRILPLFTRQSFGEHDLDVIYAWIREDHAASERVARRAGYTRDFFPYEAELAESMGRPGFVRYAAFRDVALDVERAGGH